MKILFVYPFFLSESALEQRWMTLYPPLGLLYLAAAVRLAGHSVAVFDGTFASGDEDFVAALDLHRPDVVCLASLVTLRPTALRLAGLARSRGIIAIAGGPDPTASPADYLFARASRAGEVFDVVVSGEADATLPEVLAAIEKRQSLAKLQGVVLASRTGQIVRSAARPPIPQIDALPFPTRDLIDIPRYLHAWRSAHGYASLTIAASRGCPFGCEHCANSAAGPHWRVRSIDNIVREMAELEKQYGPDRFRLVDDFDGLGREWLAALGRAMVDARLRTPFEGLKPSHLEGVPMLSEAKDICAERNAWLSSGSEDVHAAPALGLDDLLSRWREAKVREGERPPET